MWGFIMLKNFFSKLESGTEEAAESIIWTPWKLGTPQMMWLWLFVFIFLVGFFSGVKDITGLLFFSVLLSGAATLFILERGRIWDECPACGGEHPLTRGNIFFCYAEKILCVVEACRVCGKEEVVEMQPSHLLKKKGFICSECSSESGA